MVNQVRLLSSGDRAAEPGENSRLILRKDGDPVVERWGSRTWQPDCPVHRTRTGDNKVCQVSGLVESNGNIPYPVLVILIDWRPDSLHRAVRRQGGGLWGDRGPAAAIERGGGEAQ